MTTQVQFRRGTTAQNNTFTGAAGELSIDLDLKTIRVHDGATQGGFSLSTFLNINNQTTTTYTLVSSDMGKKIRINTATTSTVTVPTNLNQNILIGSVIKVRQVSSGAVQFSPEGSVTLNIPAGLTSTMSMLGGEVTLHKVATNEWDLTGNLSV